LPDVALYDLEMAWRAWILMEATDWRFLPCAGGLLDQPETLIADLLTIAALSHRVKEATKNA
jgi:hypothetical protein